VGEEGGKKKEVGRKKWDPCVAGKQPLVVGRGTAVSIFYFLFWSHEEFLGILGEWVYITPIF
jgi:hypothetical protein